MSDLETLAATARAVCALDKLDVALVKKRWLLAVADAVDAHGWQPISTAPRDGTTVDCWVGTSRLENCFFGKPYHECLSEYCDSCPDDLEVECWRWSFGNEPVTPTHWMPAPAAPAT